MERECGALPGAVEGAPVFRPASPRAVGRNSHRQSRRLRRPSRGRRPRHRAVAGIGCQTTRTLSQINDIYFVTPDGWVALRHPRCPAAPCGEWRWEFRGLRPRCRSEDRRSLRGPSRGRRPRHRAVTGIGCQTTRTLSQINDIYFVTPDGWVALRHPRCPAAPCGEWRWEFRGRSGRDAGLKTGAPYADPVGDGARVVRPTCSPQGWRRCDGRPPAVGPPRAACCRDGSRPAPH